MGRPARAGSARKGDGAALHFAPLATGGIARPLAYSALVFAIALASLVAAVVARDAARASTQLADEPFVAWLPESLPACLALAFAFALLVALLFFLLVTRWPALRSRLARIRPRGLSLSFDRRGVLSAAAVILALWAPIVVIMYPTGLTTDTFNQLYQFQTSAPTLYTTTGAVIDAEYIDHHPVFDTLLYGLFWQAGMLFGSQTAGLFALVVIQSAVLAAELAALVCYLERLGASWAFRAASLAFFAWFPIFGHYAATVLKDVTYLCFFLPWVLMWFEIFATRGDALASRRFSVLFFVLGGLCVLSKKLGLFLLVPCLVAAWASFPAWRVRIAQGACACLLACCVVLPAAANAVLGGVAPGGRQEALGFAIQQVVCLLHDDPEALSGQDRKLLGRVLDLDRAIADYEAFRADGAKAAFRESATAGDVAAFVGLWARTGLAHPASYLKSTAYTTGMLYIPFMRMGYYTETDYTARAADYRNMGTGFSVMLERPALLVRVADYLENRSLERRLSDAPVVSLFFTQGFYGGWLPVLALVLVRYARRSYQVQAGHLRYLVALAPVFFSLCLLPLSPVASPRYVLPLLYTAPLYLAWAACALDAACAAAREGLPAQEPTAPVPKAATVWEGGNA